MAKQWSTYQQAIFAAIEHGDQNLAINAVAGSGKTTTIVEAAKLMKPEDRVAFLAFNKHIVAELSARLPKTVECMTIHSLGMKACGKGFSGRLKVEQYKYHDLIDHAITDSKIVPGWAHGIFAKTVRSIVDLGRLTLTDFASMDEIDRLVGHYNMAADLVEAAEGMKTDIDTLLNKAVKIARRCLADGIKQYEKSSAIDFTDMLWLPATRNLPVPRYDVVMVDEAQDLSKAQAEIVMRAAGSGRVIAVGDPRQAIQGFAGADNASFSTLVERTQAQVLPLSVCYRCPTSHLDMAREIVPNIEAAPGADEGKIERVAQDRFLEMPHSGDLVICRVNAPLIGAALRLIGKGIQARVRGRNIGQQLVKVAKDADSLEVDGLPEDWRIAFATKLSTLVELRVDALKARKHTEAAVEAVEDQQACLSIILEGRPAITSIEQLVDAIDGLFSDEHAAVWLSSIHRAKGLEADRVFVLKPDKMALTHQNQTWWQREQEQNLRYVGLTRAKREMYFVDDPAKNGTAQA